MPLPSELLILAATFAADLPKRHPESFGARGLFGWGYRSDREKRYFRLTLLVPTPLF
jgi:hypothetical protein